jgi:hypothetical protein
MLTLLKRPNRVDAYIPTPEEGHGSGIVVFSNFLKTGC